jgi:hypothetical protein
MDILNSDWLIGMLNKAGKTPETRMLALFDVLNDWTEAPSIKSNLCLPEFPPTQGPLHTFLSLEATKAGAVLPDMLATQLCMMAQSALQETIHNNKTGLLLARNAASALIKVQTQKEFRVPKSLVYAIAAGAIGFLLVIGGIYFSGHWRHSNQKQTIALGTTPIAPDTAEPEVAATPEETAALVAQIEQMRGGDCHFIEALQLPDSYKKVYFENIILGRISTDPNEQKLVRELLSKIQCNYTPMLMKNSK